MARVPAPSTRPAPRPACPPPPSPARHGTTASPEPTVEEIVATLDSGVPAGVPALAFSLTTGAGADVPRLRGFGVEGLLGWSAPASTIAVAVVASGSASPAGDTDGGEPPSVAERSWLGQPVRVVCAMDRAGRSAGRIHVGGHREDRPPAGGRLYDALERTLGLPTAPPAAPSDALVATLWYLAVVSRCGPGAAPLRWPEVLRLHPAARALVAEDAGTGLADLEAAARLAGRVWDWEALRHASSVGGGLAELCPPELAGWMDAGMFSRWVMADLAPVAGLRAAALALVDSDARARMQRVTGAAVGGGRSM